MGFRRRLRARNLAVDVDSLVVCQLLATTPASEECTPSLPDTRLLKENSATVTGVVWRYEKFFLQDRTSTQDDQSSAARASLDAAVTAELDAKLADWQASAGRRELKGLSVRRDDATNSVGSAASRIVPTAPDPEPKDRRQMSTLGETEVSSKTIFPPRPPPSPPSPMPPPGDTEESGSTNVGLIAGAAGGGAAGLLLLVGGGYLITRRKRKAAAADGGESTVKTETSQTGAPSPSSRPASGHSTDVGGMETTDPSAAASEVSVSGGARGRLGVRDTRRSSHRMSV